jgi:hypothetical protein
LSSRRSDVLRADISIEYLVSVDETSAVDETSTVGETSIYTDIWINVAHATARRYRQVLNVTICHDWGDIAVEERTSFARLSNKMMENVSDCDEQACAGGRKLGHNSV